MLFSVDDRVFYGNSKKTWRIMHGDTFRGEPEYGLVQYMEHGQHTEFRVSEEDIMLATTIGVMEWLCMR